MESKRFILALVLSAIVLFAWQAFFLPPPPPPRQVPAETETAEAAPTPEPAQTPEAPGEEAPAEFAAEQAATEEQFEIATELFLVTFTNRGGRVLSWKLTGDEYATKDGRELDLVPTFREGQRGFPLALDVDDPQLEEEANAALYRVERTPLEGGQRITFRWADGRGVEVVKSLTLWPREYLVGAALAVRDRGRLLPARLVWGPGFGAQDPAADNSTYYYSGQVVWNQRGQVTRKRRQKVEEGRLTGNFGWAGLEDQYFAALFLPGEPEVSFAIQPQQLIREAPASANGDEEPEEEQFAAVAVSMPAEGGQIYIGPKKYRLLQSLGHDLDKAVWFSSNGFLAAVSKFLFLCLLWVHDHTIRNYGMAIVLTTFILRVLLFPVNQWSMVSIKKTQVQMQRLQPKVNGIRNKYKKKKDAESRQQMNQEMMDLYRREGVNPVGGLTGCLPMLAQFPILIGFYNMLTVAVELRNAPFFGWIQDLSQSDPYWITPLLMGVTMFLQQKMAMTKVTDPTQRQQQRIMMIMPFFFTYICIQMPSGLVLYWFVNNVLGIGQQWLVNRRADRLEAATQKA